MYWIPRQGVGAPFPGLNFGGQARQMSTTVLVIEDDLEINELLGEYLALENIRYVQAETGQAGIHQATAHKPDAIVLDLMLPDIDGFEVAKTLTAHRETYDIPILILSCMCQDADKEKGFASGALFYMNKPFLPDDLLATLHQAMQWKASLQTRAPAGTVTLGGTGNGEHGESILCSKALNQMVADLFTRTSLSDSAIAQIREAAETLNAWVRQWNVDHPVSASSGTGPSRLKLEYRVQPRGINGFPSVNGNGAMTGGSPIAAPATAGPAEVEWKLSEDTPGMLADAFFKPAPAATGTAMGGGLMGWGTSSLVTKPLAPIAPPARWLQVLAKTGAARFEKDSKSMTVRFARLATNGTHNGAGSSSGVVPVVEIDGTRYPTRLRDEALAAKRK